MATAHTEVYNCLMVYVRKAKFVEFSLKSFLDQFAEEHSHMIAREAKRLFEERMGKSFDHLNRIERLMMDRFAEAFPESERDD